MAAITIPEADLASVKPGMAATVQVDAYPSESFKGRLVRVSPIPVSARWDRPDVKEYGARIAIEPSSLPIHAGMTLRAAIRLGKVDDVLIVPRTAVYSAGGESFVLVRGASGNEKRRVVLGRSDGESVVVTAGLAEGERILRMAPRTTRGDEK